MNRIVVNNPEIPIGLHDKHINLFMSMGDILILQMDEIIYQGTSHHGMLEFHQVDWDFCFAYIMDDVLNEGEMKCTKMSLQNFIMQFNSQPIEIIDTTYGYNQIKLDGYLTINEKLHECWIEIYHLGEMASVLRD